jgi:catechol 2,3-dioxygenase-like lactoylglutathione lyase family enzyme
MIDHISIGVSNLKNAKSFYDKALKPLGYKCVYTVKIPGEGIVAHGYGEGQKPSFWIGTAEKIDKKANRKGGTHVAFVAKTRKAIDQFHKAALKAGAKDNGAPGLRPHYHPDYYGAFAYDPDGNKIEACSHHPE